ncbi:MAG: PTS sugar transporter subunit IIA [Rhodomicrobium sp.]
MRLSDIISPATIAVRVHIDDKAHALRFAASSLSARSGLECERIREALAAREALGSTGIGRGIAVPHVCFPDLDRPYALFCTLAAPIDFDAIDNKPVDLIFTIISPAASGTGGGESLAYLAAVSRTLRDPDLAAAIRGANNPWSIYDIIVKFNTTAAQLVS